MDNQQNNQNPVEQSADNLGMKWYKFLIYFSLFAGAVLNLVGGIPYLNGSIYDTASGYSGTSELVYAFYPDLKGIDTFYGIACIALAVLCIAARFSLAKYQKIGPKLLIAIYAANVVVIVIYLIVAQGIVGDSVEVGSSSVISSIIGSVFMVVVNTIYFKKRAHLFVN